MRSQFTRYVALSVISIAMTVPPVLAQNKGAPKADSQGPSMQMHETMKSGMKEMESMQMTGDADRDFAMMMRKHHEDAVKMSNMLLKSGKDPELRKFAQKVISDQTKEIGQLDNWLKQKK